MSVLLAWAKVWLRVLGKINEISPHTSFLHRWNRRGGLIRSQRAEGDGGNVLFVSVLNIVRISHRSRLDDVARLLVHRSWANSSRVP